MIQYSLAMKKVSLFTTAFLLLGFSFINCSQQNPESENVWVDLFDGETFNGWKMYGTDSDEISTKWEIEDGMIIASRDGDGPGINTGFDKSLMTVNQFENFELELEFRNSSGGNSGIMYHVIEDSTSAMDYFTGHEFQILDDYHFANQVREFQYTASVFALYPAGPKTLHPAGEWNKVRIKVDNGKTEHWLNDELVLEYDRNSEEYDSTYQASQWVNFPNWGKTQNGHFSLQDHGDMIAFRNIRIREL